MLRPFFLTLYFTFIQNISFEASQLIASLLLYAMNIYNSFSLDLQFICSTEANLIVILKKKEILCAGLAKEDPLLV